MDDDLPSVVDNFPHKKTNNSMIFHKRQVLYGLVPSYMIVIFPEVLILRFLAALVNRCFWVSLYLLVCRRRVRAPTDFSSMDYYLWDVLFVPLSLPFSLIFTLYKNLRYVYWLIVSSHETRQMHYWELSLALERFIETILTMIYRVYPFCCYCSSSYVLYNICKPFSKKLSDRTEDQHSIQGLNSVINGEEEVEDKKKRRLSIDEQNQ
ncbi:hypothetical protein BDC45DRAFT_541562 [Circinella umbellata]|nr:hypothetical protein BDC45DRAFT_541562 [Circinella umbellata]